MKTIKHTDTLVYYDGVQVFVGRDTVGGRYVGAMIDSVGDADRYLVVAVATEGLRQFCAGGIDLRSLLLESAAEGWHIALVADGFERPVCLEPQPGRLIEMDYLPEAGFLLGPAPAAAPTATP